MDVVPVTIGALKDRVLSPPSRGRDNTRSSNALLTHSRAQESRSDADSGLAASADVSAQARDGQAKRAHRRRLGDVAFLGDGHQLEAVKR